MKQQTSLAIQPIGGLGQIGSNMVALKTQNSMSLIDCGILFPWDDFYGLDYLIPDLSKVETPEKLIITHGHEDHIGAVTHVIQAFPEIEIYAPLFAAELIRNKLNYKDVQKKVNVIPYDIPVTVDNLEIHLIRVNHSIPDTYGLLINDLNNNSSTFYISDFKVDRDPAYEPPFDFEKLKKLSGDKTKRILMADSTNILSFETKTPSEKDLIPHIDEMIGNHPDRIFITTFSSNIHRIQSIHDACQKHKRILVPYGRSMENYIETAIKSGFLQASPGVLKEAKSYDDSSNIVILVSGCQGDFRSTLRRVVTGNDNKFTLREGDLLAFSSKTIPGHEKKIQAIINDAVLQGCKVITAKDKLIHASGHPGKEDLLDLYNEYQPHTIIPIHGEAAFLKAHCDFINESYPSADSIFMTNFDALSIDKQTNLSIEKEETHQALLIHGRGLTIPRENISQRRKLANQGLVVLSINKDSISKRSPDFVIDLQGLPLEHLPSDIEMNEFITTQLIDLKRNNLDYFTENIRIALRKYFSNFLGYKPITIIHAV